MGRQRRGKILRSRGASHPQSVCPMLPVKAILLLLGRPWEGSQGWPNHFLFARGTCNSRAPQTIAPPSKMRPSFLSAATDFLWQLSKQPTILLWEILMLLLAGRGNSRGAPKRWRCSEADMNALMASLSDERKTTGQATQPLDVSDSCDVRKMHRVGAGG